MWYKEWLTVRHKLILMTAIYTLIGASVILIFGQYRSRFNEGLYDYWLSIASIATVFLGMLGGLDAFSDEVDKNTLSFLLTRPISRANIFRSKIWLYGLVMSFVFFFFNFLMLLLSHLTYQNTWTDLYNPPTIEFSSIFAANSLVLLGGWSGLTLSALVSIFTRSAMQTLFVTLVIAMVIFPVFFIINGLVFSSLVSIGVTRMGNLTSFLAMLIPEILLVGGLYRAGFVSFKRRVF